MVSSVAAGTPDGEPGKPSLSKVPAWDSRLCHFSILFAGIHLPQSSRWMPDQSVRG
jgi:hypothetical protein